MLRAPDLAGCALDNRYELHVVIGEGAFGRVYRGRDRRLARAVAVKVIKPWWAEDSAWVERFEREAQLLARVSDPGIVQIFDIGHAEEGPYYVAELVEGESLAERLRRGPLPVDEARTVVEQLCDALASAHAQGVVHCDVKPANVLLTAGGMVKVGDFGIARLAEGTSQALSATVAGTPRYMSPEQARGRLTTAATDVYSAGIVLYETLAGEPPFAHGSPVELGLRHLQDEPPALPARVPSQLREVVERALAKDPAARYRDGAAMAAALRAADTPAASAPAGAAAIGRVRDRERATGATATATLAMSEPATIDLASVQTLDAGAARTRLLLPRAPASPPPPRPPARRAERRARRRRWIAPLAALLALAGATFAALLLAGGAALRVVLSAGPAPVKVPGVVGEPSSSADEQIAGAGLRYRATFVAAPGSEPGAVTSQSPAPTATVAHGSTVALSVAETPRWRALTTFSGVDGGRSVAFRILGSRWRVSYSMAYEGTCTLLFVCFGPSAEAENLQTGSSFGGFELGEGSSQTHTFDEGPGLYRVVVSSGHDSARWSMTVEDYY